MPTSSQSNPHIVHQWLEARWWWTSADHRSYNEILYITSKLWISLEQFISLTNSQSIPYIFLKKNTHHWWFASNVLQLSTDSSINITIRPNDEFHFSEDSFFSTSTCKKCKQALGLFKNIFSLALHGHYLSSGPPEILPGQFPVFTLMDSWTLRRFQLSLRGLRAVPLWNRQAHEGSFAGFLSLL